MEYRSTRGSGCRQTSAGAILYGLAPDGGLFVPETIPQFTANELAELGNLPYPELAAQILSRWLPDYSRDELLSYCQAAYAPERFGGAEPAPLHAVGDGVHVLELWHGPTCAFKDFALQLLPWLLPAASRKCGADKKIAILVATSGDTGKAALAGFAGVPGTCIGVFYPDGGVSDMQRLQMVTQEGENVAVFAVRGNFDDAQSGVKAIFGNQELAAELADRGILLSSANSINWGRLAPQIVYYFSAYARLVRQGAVQPGQKVSFCVPTGNFGNILAGYLAKKSGLPVEKLVCASNENHVLADFIETGVYDRNRPFVQTQSPSMDILVSSNLERLLFLLSGRDAARCRGWMESLRRDGRYEIGAELLRALHDEGFACGWADDAQTSAEIARVFRRSGYLCDTHTGVAMRVQRKYRERTGDGTPMVVLSTASPFKFAPAILAALGSDAESDEFESLGRLAELSGQPAPESLSGLRQKPVRFDEVCTKEAMRDVVRGWLEKEIQQ